MWPDPQFMVVLSRVNKEQKYSSYKVILCVVYMSVYTHTQVYSLLLYKPPSHNRDKASQLLRWPVVQLLSAVKRL